MTLGKKMSDSSGVKLYYEAILLAYKGKNIESVNFSETEAAIDKTPLDPQSKQRLRNLLFKWRFSNLFAAKSSRLTAPRKTVLFKVVNTKQTTIDATHPVLAENELETVALEKKEDRNNTRHQEIRRVTSIKQQQHTVGYISIKLELKADREKERRMEKERLDRIMPTVETNYDVRYLDYPPYPMERLGLSRKPDVDFEEYQISDLEDGEIV